MPTITDFDNWLDVNEPEDDEDRDNLIESVENEKDCGQYCTHRKGNQLFVEGWGDDILRLASEEAKTEFLRRVRTLAMPDELDTDFKRAIDNPNS